MDAMTGTDEDDPLSNPTSGTVSYYKTLKNSSLKGKGLVFFRSLNEIPNYVHVSKILSSQGAEIIELDSQAEPLQGFLTLLNMDMKSDLTEYLLKDASPEIKLTNIDDIVSYNMEDLAIRAPYGQERFEGILLDTTTEIAFKDKVRFGK